MTSSVLEKLMASMDMGPIMKQVWIAGFLDGTHIDGYVSLVFPIPFVVSCIRVTISEFPFVFGSIRICEQQVQHTTGPTGSNRSKVQRVQQVPRLLKEYRAQQVHGAGMRVTWDPRRVHSQYKVTARNVM